MDYFNGPKSVLLRKLVMLVLFAIVVNSSIGMYSFIIGSDLTFNSLFGAVSVFGDVDPFSVPEGDAEGTAVFDYDDSVIPEVSTVMGYFVGVGVFVASIIIFLVLFMISFYPVAIAAIAAFLWLLSGFFLESEPFFSGYQRILPFLTGLVFLILKSRELKEKDSYEEEDDEEEEPPVTKVDL